MNEDIRLWERVKIFILSISIIPIWNLLRARIKLSDLFGSLLFLSLVAFILERFNLLPISLKFLSNIFLLISLFVIYTILVLVDRWKNRIDIANYRKWKNIPNAGEIKRLKELSNEKSNQESNRNVPEMVS